MKIGIIGFPVADVDVREVARAVEALGFESLFYPEHTHIPATRESAFPATEDGSLPEVYLRNLDPFVALGAAAAVTTELVLGTGVCLVAQRDPFVTAKAVATLDQLSRGRFVLGVGAGWNVEEMENHGVPRKRRWTVVEEHVRAMQALWTQDEASFHGEFVGFDRVWSWPKPVQRPHPPILIGGNAPGPSIGWWTTATDGSRPSTTSWRRCSNGSTRCAGAATPTVSRARSRSPTGRCARLRRGSSPP